MYDAEHLAKCDLASLVGCAKLMIMLRVMENGVGIHLAGGGITYTSELAMMVVDFHRVKL